MRIKNFLVIIHWFSSSQLGVNFIVFTRSILNFPKYLLDFWAFRRSYVGKMKLMPCLHDRHEEAGSTKNEYFWQDLLVAPAIYSANPNKHVDIGSRLDGFVAHVASFRECEVFNFRSISTVVPGVLFRQADLMRLDNFPEMSEDGYCDSLSCLHAIEHFGLGRYGDPIDPTGYRGRGSQTWRIYCSQMEHFIFPHRSVMSEWNSMQIGSLIPAVFFNYVKASG